MAPTAKFEVEGRSFKFRKPHLGPSRRADEAVEEVKALGEKISKLDRDMTPEEASEVFEVRRRFKAARLALVADAVGRVDPGAAAQLEDILDDDSLQDFFAQIIAFVNGAAPGEAGRP
jgi:hypothetical protein